MKISTAIHWIALMVFWALEVADWTTPGAAPKALDFIQDISIDVLIGAFFYRLGADAGKKKTITTSTKAAT